MASPVAVDERQKQDSWEAKEDHNMGPGGGDTQTANDVPADDRRSGQEISVDFGRGSSPGGASQPAGRNDVSFREKQVKPNKVYVGGLPEHTRQEDLQSCFGKIGNIVNIELKVGYGFVEFDSREAAETSVAKYHEGFFMGNKIRVELSHGGGRTAKYSGDPGACFKCGQMGHWARECTQHGGSSRRSHHSSEPPLLDRIQPSRDYPPPRDYSSYRDELGPPGRYPPRDARYGYDYPPPSSREYRRPPSPMREYREYPPGPPPRPPRDYDDYRVRGPPPPPPPSRYEVSRSYYPPDDPMGYPPRGHGPPPPRDVYDRYDRRTPATDRYSYPPPGIKPRTPPGGPPSRGRDDYDRAPPRDYPPPGDFRGRPISPPPRYAPDYVPRPGSPEVGVQRYRRRSGSPPPRSSGNAHYEAASFAGNGYSGSSIAPPSSGAPPRASGGSRDYLARNGREAAEPSGGSYRRP